jgi:hypothetical protein
VSVSLLGRKSLRARNSAVWFTDEPAGPTTEDICATEENKLCLIPTSFHSSLLRNTALIKEMNHSLCIHSFSHSFVDLLIYSRYVLSPYYVKNMGRKAKKKS